jgi:hypothetical protein
MQPSRVFSNPKSVFLPVGLLIATMAASAGMAAADPVQQHCPAQGAQQIDIINGPVGCDEAYQIIGGYDRQGQKYQEIQGFTCYSGNAATLPMVLSCVSGNADFTVNSMGS